MTCVFGELKESRVVEKGTLCKMARGEMVRWMAQRQVTEPEELPSFSALGYQYDPARSSADRLVFLAGDQQRGGEVNTSEHYFSDVLIF